MSRSFLISLLILSVGTALPPLATATSLSQLLKERLEEEPDSSVEQVTSVLQLSNVQPTDWAFQAVQSLAKRYNCIVGYENSTVRGNRVRVSMNLLLG